MPGGLCGEGDVVDDGAVAEPDEAFGSGGDLRVVRGEQDRHVVLGGQAGKQIEDLGGQLSPGTTPPQTAAGSPWG